MKNVINIVIVGVLVILFSCPALATNGTNLIGIGPVSRSMGGIGIAAPQDAISAVFSNPAAMCFGPCCPSSEFNFAGTAFAPKVDAKVTQGGTTTAADGKDNVYAIPAIGISTPLKSGRNAWRFGLAAYGVSGLGVDYRSTALDDTTVVPAGAFTELQVMKFAPAIAFQPRLDLSLGLAFHIDYSRADFRNGSSPGYSTGIQVGAIYMPTTRLSLGVNYVSAQNTEHENVLGLGGANFDLNLESPQQFGFGAGYTFWG